jgi:hypothetical protein
MKLKENIIKLTDKMENGLKAVSDKFNDKIGDPIYYALKNARCNFWNAHDDFSDWIRTHKRLFRLGYATTTAIAVPLAYAATAALNAPVFTVCACAIAATINLGSGQIREN